MNDDGSVLSGEALERYTKRRGLCHLCARTQTHQPKSNLLKRLQTKNSWDPITVINDNNEYVVYKGFCITPTCYSLKQAQIILGETPTNESRNNNEDLNSSLTSFQSLHPPAPVESMNSPSSTEISSKSSSVCFSAPAANKKSFSPKGAMKNFKSLQLERSLRSSSTSHHSSDFSFTASSQWFQNSATSFRNGKKKRSPSKILSKRASCRQEESTTSFAAAMSQEGGIPRSTTTTTSNSAAATANSVGGRLLQYLNDTTSSTLDISNIKLSSSKTIPSLLKALEQLQEHRDDRVPSCLILNRCKLSDRGLTTLVRGLEGIVAGGDDDNNNNKVIITMSLRNNRFGKKGLMKASSFVKRLHELDISKNKFDSDGGMESTLFGALLSSKSITNLNLSNTKLWECSLTALHFFRTNNTLTVLNLESNYFRDTSIVALLCALKENPQMKLQTLLLSDNSFGDQGLEAIVDLMKVSSTLRQISIGNNLITNVGAEMILQTLRLKKNGNTACCKAPIESIQGLQDNHRITDKTLVLQISKQLEVMLHNRNFCRESKAGTVIEIGNITFFSNEEHRFNNKHNRGCDNDAPSTRTETTATIDTQLSSPSSSSQQSNTKAGPSMPPQRRFVIDGDDEMIETSCPAASKEGGGGNKWWMSNIDRTLSNASISDVSSAGGGGGGYSTTASSSVMTGDSSTVGSISLVDPTDYIVPAATNSTDDHDDDDNNGGGDQSSCPIDAGSSSIFNIEFNQSLNLFFDDDDGEEIPVEQGFEIDLPSTQEQFHMSSLSTIEGTTSTAATFTC